MNSSNTLKFNPLIPWLWFWLVFYIIYTPDRIADWINTLEHAKHKMPQAYNFTLQIQPLLSTLTNIGEILPDIAVFIGVLTIFIPKLRTLLINRELKRRYKCTINDPPNIPAFSEIKEFLSPYSKNIKIYFTLGNVTPFVYPIGFRDSAIVIPASLVKLWRSERSRAEAILLHEIAHCIHGDVIIVGAGSLFEKIFKYFLPISILSFIIPHILLTILNGVYFYNKYTALGVPPLSIIYTRLTSFITITLPGLISLTTAYLLWITGTFMLPIAGIWCSELYADRFAMEASMSSKGLRDALDKQQARFSWRHHLFSCLSHPPPNLRKWFSEKYNSKYSFPILFAAIYPMAYLVKLVILLIWDIFVNITTGKYLDNFPGNIDIILNSLKENINTYFHVLAPTYLAMSLIFLVWPITVRYWEGYFSGLNKAYNHASHKIYISCSIIMGTLYLFST